LGLQIDLGAPVEQQPLRGLAAVGAVGPLTHRDLALVDAARLAARDIFEELRALRVALSVLDKRGDVGMRIPHHADAGEMRLRTLAVERDAKIEARKFGAQIGAMQ